jgi:hypothetical protein
MFRSFSKWGARVRDEGPTKSIRACFIANWVIEMNGMDRCMDGFVGVDSSCEAGVGNCDE